MNGAYERVWENSICEFFHTLSFFCYNPDKGLVLFLLFLFFGKLPYALFF